MEHHHINHRPASSRTLNQKWIKAAVIGSIWAAIEIIAGSFLHNLRVPFSGTMLSMAAVFLMVAFARHWPERGIIIRAGIITAILKSVSPSAVILGPMVGIVMEAFILEMTWLLIGRNIFGFMIGGMLAVTWAFFQKILNLLILYGFDLVRIADAFYQYLVSKTGLEELSPVYLISLVISIYAIAGMLSALAGNRAYGRIGQYPEKNASKLDQEETDGPFFETSDKEKYASLNLLLVILLLGTSLFFLNRNIYVPALLTGGAMIIYTLLRYRNSVRHLKKISIWIQLLLITLLATLMWEWIQSGTLFSARGLVVGLEMNFRAMVVIFSFSAISVELRNPLVRSLLYRNGLSNLYKSISLAFTTLPAVIEQLPQVKNLFRQRSKILEKVCYLAGDLLDYMNREPVYHNNIFILTGGIHSGKTTTLSSLIKELKQKGMAVSGFIAKGTFKNNRRDSFQITDIHSGNSMPLASMNRVQGWYRYRSFYFNPDAFMMGEKIVTDALENLTEAIIVDEVGPMELEGKGWHRALNLLQNDYTTPQVWVVRDGILKEVSEKWHIPEENIFHPGSDPSDGLLSKIVTFQSKRDESI